MNSFLSRRLAEVLSQRFNESFQLDSTLEGVETLLSMAEHSSHRAWRAQSVPESLLRLLAACALSAPSKSDLQQASIIDVHDPAQREAINALVPQFPWMQDAPAFLVFCGDGSRLRRIFSKNDAPFVNEHLDQFFNAVVDGSLVMMNFMRAATTAGLVHCPISMIRNEAGELDRILKLPGHVFPIAGLCVGYPKEEGSVVPRLPLSLSLHRDHYDDAGSAALLAAYDEVRLKAARDPARATPWTEGKLKQYSTVQRDDWGEYIRSKGFKLD